MKSIIRKFAVVALFALSFGAHAGPFSDYLETQIIKYWFQNGSVDPKPGSLYLGLSTSACSDSSVGSEVTGGSYTRVQVVTNNTNWTGPSANNGTVLNGVQIAFPAPTADWGRVTHWHISDALSGGNLLVCAALTTPKTINNGDPSPSFPINSLSIQIDN